MARIESSVTSLSWLPREAVEGLTRVPFDLGVTTYDMPPPDELTDLPALLRDARVRFANELRAWIDVEDGRITAHGHSGRGHIGITKVRFGPFGMRLPAVSFPDIRPAPEVGDRSVRFVQTAGGRPSLPAPRRLRRKPYVQIVSPTVWSTLSLTIDADGSSNYEVVGASTFPRHWIYDHEGKVAAKIGLIDFETWYRESFGDHTPWGDYEAPALVTAVESELERQLSVLVMSSRPRHRRVHPGDVLIRQGDADDQLLLLFDGVVEVEKDGESITELGPGTILGEMAVLTGGRRTATVRARTPCRIAIVASDQIDKEALRRLAESREGPLREG